MYVQKCKKCGTTENVNFEGMCKKCYEESLGFNKNTVSNRKIEYTNSSNNSNRIADKFTLVVNITKILGYLCAIIIAIVMMINVSLWSGLLVGLVIAGIVWFSTLLFEAIAEGLNLLQDIKNKL
jgi:hypothetical protein